MHSYLAANPRCIDGRYSSTISCVTSGVGVIHDLGAGQGEAGAYMAAHSGGRHRERRPRRGPIATGHRRQRPAHRSEALTAAATVAIGLLATVPAAPAAAVPGVNPAPTVQRDVALTDSARTDSTPTDAAAPAAATPPTFDDSLKDLLDNAGFGTHTLPQIFGGTGTVGQVLAGSGLSLTDSLSPTGLFDALGLNSYTLGDVLTDLGLNPSLTMDDVLGKMQMLNVPLDFYLTPLGIPSTQTTLGLAHRFSVAHLTLDQMLQRVGFSGDMTLKEAMEKVNIYDAYLNLSNGNQTMSALMGISGLVGNMTCPTAIGDGMTIDQFIQCLTYDGSEPSNNGSYNPPHGSVHLSGSTTIQQILDSQHFYDDASQHTDRIIGNWTIGEILNFNSTTTVRQFLDNLHVNFDVTATDDNGSVDVPPGTVVGALPTLGSKTFGEFLTWIDLDPTKTLAQLSTEIMIGSQPLSDFTLQDALDHLMLNPLAIGPSGSEIEDSTPFADFLTGLGGPLATETVDQLLHLAP